jgi:hypothetical protein
MDVCLKCHLPFFIADVPDVFERGLVSSVVDKDVKAAPLFNRTLDDLAAMPRIL